jgi:hypothetical protein
MWVHYQLNWVSKFILSVKVSRKWIIFAFNLGQNNTMIASRVIHKSGQLHLIRNLTWNINRKVDISLLINLILLTRRYCLRD